MFIREIIAAGVRLSCEITVAPRLVKVTPLMHHSIPGAPKTPGGNLWVLAFFPIDGKFPGAGTLEPLNAHRRGRKKREMAPPQSAALFIDRTVE